MTAGIGSCHYDGETEDICCIGWVGGWMIPLSDISSIDGFLADLTPGFFFTGDLVLFPNFSLSYRPYPSLQQS